jgi:hypothetical protein
MQPRDLPVRKSDLDDHPDRKHHGRRMVHTALIAPSATASAGGLVGGPAEARSVIVGLERSDLSWG